MDAAPPPLHDYLRAGIAAADLPDLHPLLSARDLLRAFSTLFHGGEESVMVRLLVLRTIGERGQAPDWAPQELRDQTKFPLVDDAFVTVIEGRQPGVRALVDRDLLEREIVPMVYDRGQSATPRRWVAAMKASIRELLPRFSANRMVREYAEAAYAPLAAAAREKERQAP